MKRALHTVSYAGFWRGQERLSLDATLVKAAELGFDGVEIVGKRPHLSLLDYGPAERLALRNHLHRLGLECACVAGYTNFTADADHPEAPMREIQVAYVAELARLASDIGAPIVRVFTGYERDDVPFGTQWDWCVTALRECAVRADSYGVSIAIQNHHDIAVTAADLVDLIQEIHHPRCGAAFDAWAPALQGLNVERETERIAPYVIHTTVADYELRPRFGYRGGLVNYQRRQDRTVAVPVGQGVVDYAGFLGVLRSHGYEGYVAYEMCSELVGGGGMDRLDRCARGFLDFMNTLPARAERRAE